MKRVQYGNGRSSGGVDINISPLIDVVFLLLIFFVVTTVFVKETGVEVRKPTAISAEALDQRSLQLALTRDGRVVYDGRDVSLNAVRGIVARQIAQRETPVILFADEAAPSGRLVALVDECKLAGADTVSIAAHRGD